MHREGGPHPTLQVLGKGRPMMAVLVMKGKQTIPEVGGRKNPGLGGSLFLLRRKVEREKERKH